MKLSLDHLMVLRFLAQSDSVTTVAERLSMTPSAVSHRLREAERRLGVDLTERIGGRLRLSPAGLRLERAADEVIALLNEAEMEANAIASGVSAFVRIGVIPYGPSRWIAPFIQHYAQRRPDVEINLFTLARDQVYASLMQGRVDIAIVDDGMVSSGSNKIPLFRDELVLVTGNQHPLADKQRVEAYDLKPYDSVTYSIVRINGWEYDRFFAPATTMPRRLITIESLETIIDLVCSNYAISILLRDSVAPALKRGELSCASLGGGVHIGWNAIIRPHEPEQSETHQMVMVMQAWLQQYFVA